MSYFKVNGGKKLHGSISVNGSKNGAVAILAASVMNRGVTTLHNVPQIEEVNRWIEILESIGMVIERKGKTLILTPPKKIAIQNINKKAAEKTRSAILLISSLIRQSKSYMIPQSGGCKLGARTIKPHLYALEPYGIAINSTIKGFGVEYSKLAAVKNNVLYESGDTVTETAVMAAAQIPGKTVIKMATSNYMVQDLCYFLLKLGIKINGIGTTTIEVHGKKTIKKNISYTISEDPIEAMFFISLAIVTKSQLKIKRCPIEFLELELLKLQKMGQKFRVTRAYKSKNKKTQLVNIIMQPSKLIALEDKIHALPFPGINMDNLPFFVPIAICAKGKTLIHDWVYENRAVYFTELNRLGAQINLIDSHRITVTGPSMLNGVDLTAPPALRPAAIMLVAMIGASKTSILRNIYSINRGYEDLENRLRSIGVDIVFCEEKSN